MVPRQPSLVEQLRGATRLAAVATRGVTDLVEQLHQTIGGGPAILGSPLAGVMKLITAPTYGAVRGVTNVVAAGIDRALELLQPELDQAGAERGALLAALNGVLGDYLAQTGSALAIEPCLVSQGKVLDTDRAVLAATFPHETAPRAAGEAGARLLVLVHGSSADESCWQREGHDHGAALAAELGVVPLFYRYNSGLHVSQNGRLLAAMLERLVTNWPREVDQVVLLAHSMGGLVARSACHAAEEAGHTWRPKLRALVTLGTPHHGAPLERSGNWLETMLGLTRYSAPFARLARLRSAGVTDLRYGNVLDADWEGEDRFVRREDPRQPLPLPAGVACFAVAATSSKELSTSMLGDGLVPVDSALGRHAEPARTLDFGDGHGFVALGHLHLDLLSSRSVYEKVLEWLRPLVAG